MYRQIPIGNKICAKRRVQRDQELHREKIRQMKPQTDTSEPEVRRLNHIRNNLKREQMLEERYSEIDRENRILLQKMADVMRSTPDFVVAKPKTIGAPISLNKDYRRQELIRITHENQAILKRIQRAQPVYSHMEWQRAHKRNISYLKNACEYPVVLRPKDELIERKRPVELELAIEPDHEVTQDLGGNTRYVLKEGKKIGGNYYLVEMTTDGRTLTVSAYDGDTQKTLELLVNEKNHRKLYRECNRDYTEMAKRLVIDGDKLTLSGLTHSYSAPEKPWNADDLVKESERRRKPDKSEKGDKAKAPVQVDVVADGPTATLNVHGVTPTTPSIRSGYN